MATQPRCHPWRAHAAVHGGRDRTYPEKRRRILHVDDASQGMFKIQENGAAAGQARAPRRLTCMPKTDGRFFICDYDTYGPGDLQEV